MIKLHHIAYVTDDVQAKAAAMTRQYGCRIASGPTVAPEQGVRIIFMDMGQTQIELLEPHGDNSPVAKFLAKGGGLYHLCFEVDNLDEHLDTLQKQGAFIIKPPTLATALQNRRVAFVLMPDKDLVEFLEAEA